jgi:hypothetical protein
MSSSYSVEQGELWVQNDTSVAPDDVIIQGLMIMLGCIYLLQCLCCCSTSGHAFCFLIHLLGVFSRSRTRCYCCGSSFLYDIDRVQEEVCLEKRPRSIVEEMYMSKTSFPSGHSTISVSSFNLTLTFIALCMPLSVPIPAIDSHPPLYLPTLHSLDLCRRPSNAP